MSIATVRPPKFAPCPDCGSRTERRRLYLPELGRIEWVYACFRVATCGWEGQPVKFYQGPEKAS